MSNVKSGTLTIIDASCNTIVKNIFVGMRPFKLAVIDNNKIYIACDRSNIVSVVDCVSYEESKIYVPNDGNIEIDKLNHKIFISNTSEIIIYDTIADKIISNIIGLVSITDIKLSKDCSKLYVIDKLLSEFSIYNTVNSKLIYVMKNLGINPGCFLISEDDTTAYISVEISGQDKNHFNILKLDIHNKKIISLELPEGSIISGMLIKGNSLYVANKGLNRIELVNTETYKVYDSIVTSKPKPSRLCLNEDETKLLVTNRNDGAKGSLDIIDTTTNHIIATILMDSKDSQPYDVVVVSLRLSELDYSPVAITDLNATKEPLIIIAKKVFACHREIVNFPNVNMCLTEENNQTYILEKIKFKNGVIVKDSETRTSIGQMPGFARIEFTIRINYIINYLDTNKNRYEFEGFLEKNQGITVAIPTKRDVNEFELIMKATSRLITPPSLIDNVVNFKVGLSFEIKIVAEDEISLEALQQNVRAMNVEENFQPFVGFSGSLFPEGTNFQKAPI